MDLFSASNNLLPYDGYVEYFGTILSSEKSRAYFDQLLNTIHWENDKALLFGKEIITKRKVAWYGDKPFDYSYSNYTKSALPWTKELLELKSLVEQVTNETFNSCLMNLYHSGEEGMAYHSDDEKDLKENGAIASLSFGATRKFLFKHKLTKLTVFQILEPGSLLVMKGPTQKHWLHRLPPTTKA
ncbi:MAG: alpha-ketoglutarate-dependent dioxygenase AlkB, partial [Bacteroidetes bacterium]|nr:alpha-ketoglutarate-dependent dioxygenase AlkB [Bacteroidota bacterium]